ncbi:MAG: hypothetical protein M3Y93_07825 [Pseudomonadota bacterium]|nr:hypothetical protein [Pseudomonadota bacterium]
MKYLGVAYFTPEKFAAMVPEDVKELLSQCPALDEKMRAIGSIMMLPLNNSAAPPLAQLGYSRW